MTLFRRKKDKDKEDLSSEESEDDLGGPTRRRSVLAMDANKRRASKMNTFNFTKKKGTVNVEKLTRKNKLLTNKQVQKLNAMEPYEIARNHDFSELEYIVDSLTKIYAQIYQQRDEIRRAKLEKPPIELLKAASKGTPSVNSKTSGNSKKEKLAKVKKKKSKRKTNRRKRLTKGRNASMHGKKSLRKGSIGLGDAAVALRRSVGRAGGRIGSIGRNGSMPDFAKLANRIKNVKTTKDEILPIDKLMEYNGFEVENALEKSDRAMKAHRNFKDKEKKRWSTWEKENEKENTSCLLQMQAVVPPDLKYLKEETLAEKLGGNVFLAKRMNRHKVFLLFNLSFDQLQAVHPADLKNRYHIGGLDMVELRALYSHTEGVKRPWRMKLRQKLAMQIEKEKNGQLEEKEKRHPSYSNKPDFREERKPSVVAFMHKRNSVTEEYGGSKRAPSVVAQELQKRYGLPMEKGGPSVPLPKEKERKEERVIVKKKKKIKLKEKSSSGELKSIYLVKKRPDRPVDTRTLGRKSNSGSKERDNSSEGGNGGKLHRRPKDNIFSAFEKQNSLQTKTKSKTKGKSSTRKGKGRKKETDMAVDKMAEGEAGKAPELESYFDKRESLEVKEEKEEERRKSVFDYDDKEYDIKPTDHVRDMKRKKSELMQKAFEMISSDDVDEEDEVFLKTLRKLSVFTATMSENELDEELSKYSNDEEREAKPDTSRSFYLNAPRRVQSQVSVPESAYTENEFLNDIL